MLGRKTSICGHNSTSESEFGWDDRHCDRFAFKGAFVLHARNYLYDKKLAKENPSEIETFD